MQRHRRERRRRAPRATAAGPAAAATGPAAASTATRPAAPAAPTTTSAPTVSVEGHPVATVQGRRPASATLIVGPEGGWSQEEIEIAVRAGWVPITLGRRTLRADAVAIVAIGILQFLWADL